MKHFADLHLRAPIRNLPKAENMIKKASELGYQLVAIPLPYNAGREQIGEIKKICKRAKLDFATRVNLFPRTSNELLHDLRSLRRKFEIVAVRCLTKDVARKAANDRRVDILQFSVTNMRQRFFDEQEAELASQVLSSLEIELAPLLQLTRFSRVHLLYALRKEAAIAKRAQVPMTLSSGATNEMLMRGPYDFAALTTLFNLPLDLALKGFSENSLVIVERNRKKLSSDYVAPGIHIVGRKKYD